MAKEISKVVKLQVREVLRIHRHRLDLLSCWCNIMEFCKQFNAELKIKPAKYAQYKLLYKDKSFEFVVKTPPAAVQLMEAAKLKSGSEPNRKKSS
jgi:large subunit ribosomal protein L11